MKLLVTLALCKTDRDLALNLLIWIGELGGVKENPCLLVVDGKITKEELDPIIQAAGKAFNSVSIIRPPMSLPDESWPKGANWMFQTAAQHISADVKMPWLWLEPDAVPMKEGWLRQIEVAYEKCGKQFMGEICRPGKPSLPPQMLFGIAVYPAQLPKVIFQRLISKRNVAWDVSCADVIVPLASHSILFWNFPNKETPPTYVRKREPGHPHNALELSKIPGHVVLAHTSKDGSLISVLRGDGEPTIPQIIMAHKIAKKQKTGVLSYSISKAKPIRYVHCVERHIQKDADSERRVMRAFNSWVELYKTGRFVPCHVWDYPRHAGEIGDSRKLPYLKDILVEGMTKAGDEDVIVLTNDDTVLHPKIIEALDDKMKKVDACASFRVNFRNDDFPKLSEPVETISKTGRPDLGRDLFAFRKQWLKDHWFNLPDFFLGELEFDLVLSVMIRRSAGIFTDRTNLKQPMPACELERGLILHEFHERQWTSGTHKVSPAKKHNRNLAVQFYSSNGFPSLISVF